MEIKAAAKINLFLNVGNKRPDNFHDFQSVVVKVSLFDELIIEEASDITVEAPEWIAKEDNLVYRAAVLLKEFAETEKGCSISLKKNIPTGAGLGGGSSNAAAVFTALNKLWDLNLSISQLEEIGAVLGSDVNLFLHPGGTLATGRGEVVKPLPYENPEKKKILLINPGVNISTEKVYSRYPGGRLTPEDELNKIIENYTQGNWALILRNDLEETVFSEYPVLRDLKSRLINWGAQPLLSGSGSTVFALVEDDKLAESIKNVVENSFNFDCWIVNEII
ncbi:MAG: 4-(cytidine 5'-diphospho)-2-C-methyl-D-erythritol kinase [Clostridiales bacterium]|nr:4-(cytidine 5'-diphospho)-2-C-methyl-D-erythritol kinase [Clostridiales bacterium]